MILHGPNAVILARSSSQVLQDGNGPRSEAENDAHLGTPEALAANMLEAFAAADAPSQGAAPAEWTIASFGSGEDFGADGDPAGAKTCPAGQALTVARLSELESDGDDGSEVGSELSLLRPTPPRGHGADTTSREASDTTLDSAVVSASAAESTRHAGADFTFSTAPDGSHGHAYVSPVWGPLLRSAAPASSAAARSARVAGVSTITAASQPLAESNVAPMSQSGAKVSEQQPATSEQLLARLAALDVPPMPAVVRQLRAAAEALCGEGEAFAAHVAMAQVLLDKKVPWLVRASQRACAVRSPPCIHMNGCCVCNLLICCVVSMLPTRLTAKHAYPTLAGSGEPEGSAGAAARPARVVSPGRRAVWASAVQRLSGGVPIGSAGATCSR